MKEQKYESILILISVDLIEEAAGSGEEHVREFSNGYVVEQKRILHDGLFPRWNCRILVVQSRRAGESYVTGREGELCSLIIFLGMKKLS